MKYKMSMVIAEDKGFEIPDDVMVIGAIPDYKTNKWAVIFLVPVEEEEKEETAEESKPL